MRMHQPIAEFDDALREEIAIDRAVAQARIHQAQVRTRRRRVEKSKKHGTLRFWALCLLLVATAVGVTVAMFQTLYIVMG